MPVTNSDDQDKVEFNQTLILSRQTVEILEKLKVEYGVASKGKVIEILLHELFTTAEF